MKAPSVENQMLHLCLHLVVHFIYSGFGLRQLTDIFVLIKNRGIEIDWNSFNEKIEECKIQRFVIVLFEICRRLLDMKVPDSITNISLDAIEGCTNLTTMYFNVGSVTITCIWGYGKINSQIGFISEGLIKDSIASAKDILVDSNIALSNYIKAGGLQTDAVYKNLKELITIPSTNILINGDTIIYKLKVVWTPTKAGTYDYSNGTITKIQDFSINSFTSSIIDNLKVGTSVVLQGNATSDASNIQYKMSVINPKNETTIIKDYSTSNISTWTPLEVGNYTLVLDVKDSNGRALRTEMKLSTYAVSSHITTIYYKGYSTPYIHYKVGVGSWTQVPGIEMIATRDKPGYTHKMTIDLGDADILTVCFNNGNGNWDSRNGANYTFKVGVYTYSNGSSSLIN